MPAGAGFWATAKISRQVLSLRVRTFANPSESRSYSAFRAVAASRFSSGSVSVGPGVAAMVGTQNFEGFRSACRVGEPALEIAFALIRARLRGDETAAAGVMPDCGHDDIEICLARDRNRSASFTT